MISYSFLVAVVLIIIRSQPAEAIQALNTTAKNEIVVCTYPISGQYGAFPRILYYLSIIFAIVARHNEWLVAGALSSAMIFSSTCVVHILVILGSQGSNPDVIDLDVLAITVMLLTGTLLFGPMMDFSSTVRESRARPIIAIWGVWVWFGTLICLIAGWTMSSGPNPTPDNRPAIKIVPPRSSEIFCLSTNGTVGTLLQSASQLQEDMAFNCTYDCFSSRASRIRGQDEILAISQGSTYNSFQGALWGLTVIGTILGIGGLAMIGLGKKPYSVRREEALQWDRGHQLAIAYNRGRTATGGNALGRLYSYLLAAMSIPVIVIGELYLLGGSGLPKGEEYYAIGQWAPLVSAVLIIFAALFDRYFLQEDDGDKLEARNVPPSSTGYAVQVSSDDGDQEPLSSRSPPRANLHRDSHDSLDASQGRHNMQDIGNMIHRPPGIELRIFDEFSQAASNRMNTFAGGNGSAEERRSSTVV